MIVCTTSCAALVLKIICIAYNNNNKMALFNDFEYFTKSMYCSSYWVLLKIRQQHNEYCLVALSMVACSHRLVVDPQSTATQIEE